MKLRSGVGLNELLGARPGACKRNKRDEDCKQSSAADDDERQDEAFVSHGGKRWREVLGNPAISIDVLERRMNYPANTAAIYQGEQGRAGHQKRARREKQIDGDVSTSLRDRNSLNPIHEQNQYVEENSGHDENCVSPPRPIQFTHELFVYGFDHV